MLSEAQSMPSAVEVGITPRYAPDALGYRYLSGERHWGRVRVTWSTEPTREGKHDALVHLSLHSDTLNFGFYGQGSLDTAYSVLLALTGSGRVAHALYHQFCAEVIARLPRDEFALPIAEIRDWIAANEQAVA